MANYLIDFERDLFFAQYEPERDLFRLVFKNAGTQALFQNIARSRQWKSIASYRKDDSIEQSMYLHIRGCWHLEHRTQPTIQELEEILKQVDKALATRIYKKGVENDGL